MTRNPLSEKPASSSTPSISPSPDVLEAAEATRELRISLTVGGVSRDGEQISCRVEKFSHVPLPIILGHISAFLEELSLSSRVENLASDILVEEALSTTGEVISFQKAEISGEVPGPSEF